MLERFATSTEKTLSQLTIRGLFRARGIEVEPEVESLEWRVLGGIGPPPLRISHRLLEQAYQCGGPELVRLLVGRFAEHIHDRRKLEAGPCLERAG